MATRYIRFPAEHPFHRVSEPAIHFSEGDGWIMTVVDYDMNIMEYGYHTEHDAKAAAFQWRLLRGLYTEEEGCMDIEMIAARWHLPIVEVEGVEA
ncbi:hypothetical protein [Sphingomonas sp.]|uniref:hypothetical protein n=1 Tax=Sphingomonas sp. TaxID=28214 RepID=UPI003B3AB470